MIIPVYNVEKYLEQCLRSVIKQTLTNIEIICVDDGSIDSSLKILYRMKDMDERIQIICQQNLSAGAARNQGLLAAKGEYLAFLDSDDFFEPDMLELAYNKAVETEADVVVYRSNLYDQITGEFIDGRGSVNEKYFPDMDVFSHKEVRKDFFGSFQGWPWDKLFKREFVQGNHIRFQEQKSINDLFFVYGALAKAERVTVIQNVLAHKRINNEGSISTVYSKSDTWSCFYAALMKLKEQLEDWSIYEEVKQDYINYALFFSLWNINKFFHTDNFEILYGSLKNVWFKQMDILDYGEDYFYNKGNYRRLRQILLTDAEQYKKQIFYLNSNTNFLFPCEPGQNAIKIVLYGAGNIGQECYEKIKNNGDFIICGWADQYKAGSRCMGQLLCRAEDIRDLEFDYVLLAIKDGDIAASVLVMLKEMGIKSDRIILCGE